MADDSNSPENIAHRARWAQVARSCIEQVEHAYIKGKARDRVAIAFFSGADAIRRAEGHETSMVAWLVAIRGYSEVLEVAKLDEADKAAA